MNIISVGLEWGSYPLQELQNMYDDLFVNNEKEISYIGNEKPEEVKKIKEIYSDVVDELQDKLNNKFNFKILELDI